jgi:aquaporin rerated protein, other eukaryote
MHMDFDPNNENERGQRRPIPFLPNRARNEIVAFVAEFGGTFMFLFFAFGGTQVANATAVVANGAGGQQENHLTAQARNTSVLLFISLSSGFSLAVNVWVFFRISGGLFNPAVRLNYSLFLY